MDQLVSSIPGFLAQEQANVRYKLTRRCFKAATVFVDHYSRLSYVHVHTSTGGDEAVQAKEAFEATSNGPKTFDFCPDSSPDIQRESGKTRIHIIGGTLVKTLREGC